MKKIMEKLEPVTRWKHFDKTTGILFQLNPLFLALQLVPILQGKNIDAVSLPMWGCFFLIQQCSMLVGVKAKNKGLIISMIISDVIVLMVIGITIWRRYF